MTGMLDSVSATGTCLLYVLLKKVLMFKMRKKNQIQDPGDRERERNAFPTAGSPLVYHAVYHA